MTAPSYRRETEPAADRCKQRHTQALPPWSTVCWSSRIRWWIYWVARNGPNFLSNPRKKYKLSHLPHVVDVDFLTLPTFEVPTKQSFVSCGQPHRREPAVFPHRKELKVHIHFSFPELNKWQNILIRWTLKKLWEQITSELSNQLFSNCGHVVRPTDLFASSVSACVATRDIKAQHAVAIDEMIQSSECVRRYQRWIG